MLTVQFSGFSMFSKYGKGDMYYYIRQCDIKKDSEPIDMWIYEFEPNLMKVLPYWTQSEIFFGVWDYLLDNIEIIDSTITGAMIKKNPLK